MVNSIVDGSGPLIHAVTAGDMTLPDLAWLNSIPLVGAKLYGAWHSLLDMGGSAIMAKVRPYIGTTTTWFVGQAAHIGRFMMHCGLMLLFSALLYWRGEQVALGIRHFACRLASKRGDAAILLAAQAIRAGALGVVGTALVQAAVSYTHLLANVDHFGAGIGLLMTAGQRNGVEFADRIITTQNAARVLPGNGRTGL